MCYAASDKEVSFMSIKDAVNDLNDLFKQTEITALLQRIEDLEKKVENLLNQQQQIGRAHV